MKLEDTVKNMEIRKQRIKDKGHFEFEDKPKLRGKHAKKRRLSLSSESNRAKYLCVNEDVKEVGLKRLETSVETGHHTQKHQQVGNGIPK